MPIRFAAHPSLSHATSPDLALGGRSRSAVRPARAGQRRRGAASALAACLAMLAFVGAAGTAQAAPSWSSAGSMANGRYQHSATRLANGKVLVVGGYTATGFTTGAQLYEPATNGWSSAAPMSVARRGHTATLLTNGKVLVTGGETGSGATASAELYDPATDTWAPAASMPAALYVHRATLLTSGKVLVTGGITPTGGIPSGGTASARLYDPVSNAWSAAASMTTVRYEHTMTPLANGKVLVTGGNTSPTSTASITASAELYDPAANAWTAVASMPAVRYHHTGTLLESGKVLVAGGWTNFGGRTATAALYDPTANAWFAVPSMASTRTGHTATLLADGRVLVAGGYTKNDVRIAGAELYDPVANAWSTTASMSTARDTHTATPLANGKVLVAGGIAQGFGPTPTAELYDPALDTTAPVIAPSVGGTLGDDGWYVTDADLTWTVTDAESPIRSKVGCDRVEVHADQASTSYACTATSAGGTSSRSVSIKRDAHAPIVAVTGVGDGATYTLGSTPSAGCDTRDETSGVADAATVAVAGGPVGTLTATCSGAKDNAGNRAAAVTATYAVHYAFDGFDRPIDNGGALNARKAGAAVPVKFSLGGYQGMAILAAGSPSSQSMSCDAGTPTGAGEPTLTAGSSGLSYDVTSDRYTYIWKTDKAWAGSCRLLTVTLVDGTSHTARFTFAK